MPRKSKSKSITLHDVAKEAGVSLITASRALRDPAVVSPRAMERVLKAVETTGYIPNMLAGGLKSKRSFTVAALVPTLSVAQFLPSLQSLTDELDRAGYQTIFGQTGYDRARERPLLDSMIGRRVDGIVVIGLLPEASTERLRKIGIPVVETWDITDRPVDMVVGFSHIKVGSAVAGYFLSKGWQRFGIVTGDDQRAASRREGFLSTVGHDVPTTTVPAGSNLATGREALGELLLRDPKIRAIYCSSDTLADGALTEARARGLRVPEDLAICGFGDADFAAHTEPALTTVYVDGPGIGKLAAEMIVKRCNDQVVKERIVDVGFKIIERASTAPPRS